MTQKDFGTINPTTKSGTQLAADLNDFRDSLNTKHSGAARPSYVQAGMEWLDTSAAPIWTVKLYDGSEDVILYRIDTTNNISTPTQSRQEVIKTADYTLTPADAYVAIIMNKSTAGVASLPALSTTNFELYFVKNAAANPVTIDPNLTETIEGASTLTLLTNESVWIWPASGKGSWRAAIIKTNVATLTGAETLTNKTLTAPVISTPSGEFLRGLINGCTLSNNATDAANDFDVAAGSCASDGATPVLMTTTATQVKRTDALWAAGTGNGALDTGTIGNGIYYVFRIQRSDTGVTDHLVSLSKTSPTMPANYDRKRRIGTLIRVAGSVRSFRQYEDRFEMTPAILDGAAVAVSTTQQALNVSLPPSMVGLFRVRLSPAAATNFDIILSGFTISANSGEASLSANATGGSVATEMQISVTSAGQILHRCSSTPGASTMTVTSYGWIDDRGRIA